MNTRRIEIFIGNCPLCEETVQLIQECAGSTCEVLIYNLREEMGKAQQYGVTAVPSVAVDGMLVLTGKPSRSQLEVTGIVQMDRSSQVSTDMGMYMGMGI
ncbi:MAG: thioredoxin family protein [Leptolyngbya foveolarum]|uniref:Thioredoxin family protein n=1 Tax=Leptolyngbya foveolarum TaxID=47253 RepID=A0A2W4TW06_9CYAN|nr:MAG: thioredoxin family protein [Leptolyngbya foveolarum]